MTETTERADVGPPPDAHLWDLIAQGDHAAFAELSATFLPVWRKRGEAQLVRDSALPWLHTSIAPGGSDVPAVLGNGTFVLAAPLNEDGRVVIRDAKGAILETIRPTRWRMWQ